jgi:gamma-glutamyltranspeptidase/glutathione hydrolase
MRARRTVRSLVVLTAAAVVVTGMTAAPAQSSVSPGSLSPIAPAKHGQPVPKQATAVGFGGAVSSVDVDATAAGLSVLRHGGNAVDAAVATAAALGVTEPYSAGIGGGGYFVFYNARTHKVQTLDGRETAPRTMPANAFINPATGLPYTFFPDLVTTGLSVGVPGTLATWQSALDRWGTLSLRKALDPGTRIAERGFVVDATFNKQTLDNKARFSALTPTAKLFLPNGDAPVVGSVFRNPELAATYKWIGKQGPDVLYRGQLGREIVQNVQQPPKAPGATLPVLPGYMTGSDLAAYQVIGRQPTKVGYRGLDVYGMPPSSSGGTTVGESLNILGTTDLRSKSDVDALHWYLEATARAFADRAKYVGDPAYVNVPTGELTSAGFGAERACTIDPQHAAPKPVQAGVPDGDYQTCGTPATVERRSDTEGLSTTHLTTADRWGNVVAYTLTIEQTGGSGIVVPGRGFLLNNELTDFSAVPNPADPNIIAGGKRPRSSMSPTIVLRHGKPVLALGSPGGSTIITTVLQVLTNRVDRGMSLPAAIAAPRASQRNTASVTAEQSFIDAYGSALGAYGHTFVPAGAPGTSAAEIGATTGIELLPGGGMLAAAEPVRRGGGAAAVVHQIR